MEDDDELTTVKEETGTIVLDPSIECIEFKDEMYPININIIGEINSTTASEFEDKLREAERSGQKEVAVIIQSEGGNVYDALKIVDLILTTHLQVITCVRGYAFSAASIIFSCGISRIVGPNASIMIHSVSVDSFGGTMAEMLVESKEMGRINDRMCEIMAENTGKRKDFWKKKLDGNRDIYLTSTEAVKNGLATHIGDVRLETCVTVKSRLNIMKYSKCKKKRKRSHTTAVAKAVNAD